jgi:FtsZ-binding cell division protein ZapB
MHAESERNNLMQMVEERNEEIVRLKYALEQKHSKRDDELLDKLRTEVECLRTAAALKNARATISNLQMKIEEANEANESSTMNRLIRDECNNHNDLQSKIDEYKEKIEQLQKQTKEADERISQM